MSPLLALLAFQDAPKRPVNPGKKLAVVATTDARPVTAREARAAFAQVSALLTKVHGQALGSGTIPVADRPATRAEIVTEMARVYKASEPTFRFTPAPIGYEPGKFKVDSKQKAALGRLVAIGCVAPVGPLATGPSAGLTAKEFGDALGFFMARLTQMSHLPSPKWTPMLKRDE